MASRRRRCGGGRFDSAVLTVQIAVPDETPRPAEPLSRAVATRRAGSIEIELAGDARVRVDESVNVAAPRRVLSVLRG
jgi:hypothetical protein